MRTKHGHASGRRTPTYGSYSKMISRCENKRHPAYARYGGRGITVCARWRADFRHFLADMGERPPGCELDRIDNDRGYEPGNCRWVSRSVNARNRGDVVRITANGETLTAYEWAERIGCDARTLLFRIWKGWDHERAVTTPIRKRVDSRQGNRT